MSSPINPPLNPATGPPAPFPVLWFRSWGPRATGVTGVTGVPGIGSPRSRGDPGGGLPPAGAPGMYLLLERDFFHHFEAEISHLEPAAQYSNRNRRAGARIGGSNHHTEPDTTHVKCVTLVSGTRRTGGYPAPVNPVVIPGHWTGIETLQPLPTGLERYCLIL